MAARKKLIGHYGSQVYPHVFIDLDSWKHSEVWLHVFRQALSHRDDDGNYPKVTPLIVIEEGGFYGDDKVRGPFILTDKEFEEKYEIAVPPELLEKKS